ncbi:MAG TPA: CpsB/CapC family capsule biosynthesis tyrosine phosphatase, partial [Ktedonobacteraceae bacterium]|nr:CpsB/CapC family capsule biosynthesis tyrosine phosphatase [Ktedonobacteraceae bacterium]
AQLTASSLMGMQGNTIRRCAETLLQKKLVHFIASDAHGLHKRPPGVVGGLQQAIRLLGQSHIYQMTEVWPAAVINNQSGIS